MGEATHSSPVPAAERRRASQWLSLRLQALRAFAFPESVLPVLVATAVVRPFVQWNWLHLVFALLVVLFLHCIANLLNDYFDFRSGVDNRTEGDEGRPGRLLVRGAIGSRDILMMVYFFSVLALLCGAFLIIRCGPALLWFFIPAALGLYAYTGPPIQIKYHALGEPLMLVIFGPMICLGAAYVQTGAFEWRVLPLAISCGLIVSATLAGNNMRDFEEDSAAGVRTLAQTLGRRGMSVLYLILALTVLAIPFVLAIIGRGPLALAISPLFILLLLKPLGQLRRGERVPNIDVQTAQFGTALMLYMVLALVL